MVLSPTDENARRRPGLRAAAIGLLLTAPLLPVGLQAVADEWHGPALWPQRLGGRGLRAVLDDPLIPSAVRNSAVVAVVVVVGAVALGWPAARAIAEADRPTRLALLGVVVGPVLLPPLAAGEGLATWLLRLGLSDHLAGVALAHTMAVLPYVVFGLVPAFTRELAAREEAATALGASPLLRLRTVTAPACLPFLALAAGLGFAVSWGQYATSLAVGGGIPLLPLVLVPFIRADPQIAAVLDLVFLLPPLVLVGLAALARPVGDAAHPLRRIPL